MADNSTTRVLVLILQYIHVVVLLCTFVIFVFVAFIRTRVPTAATPGVRVGLKLEAKARTWLKDVAIVCPATKSVVAVHARPSRSACEGR
jgi:hypothetical protein